MVPSEGENPSVRPRPGLQSNHPGSRPHSSRTLEAADTGDFPPAKTLGLTASSPPAWAGSAGPPQSPRCGSWNDPKRVPMPPSTSTKPWTSWPSPTVIYGWPAMLRSVMVDLSLFGNAYLVLKRDDRLMTEAIYWVSTLYMAPWGLAGGCRRSSTTTAATSTCFESADQGFSPRT